MLSFLSIYLPVFFLVYLLLVFVIPTIRIYRQTGINAFRFITYHDKVHDFVGASMKVFILLLLAVVVIYSLYTSIYKFLAPFDYLETRTLKIIGLALGHLSLVGIVIAQVQMRQSWRIGIDYENKTRLVTSGFFSFSRNPIYLFLLIGLIGLFLIVPNAITFAVLFSAFLILHVTIRLEEEYLEKVHGEAYRQYRHKVRRLL